MRSACAERSERRGPLSDELGRRRARGRKGIAPRILTYIVSISIGAVAEVRSRASESERARTKITGYKKEEHIICITRIDEATILIAISLAVLDLLLLFSLGTASRKRSVNKWSAARRGHFRTHSPANSIISSCSHSSASSLSLSRCTFRVIAVHSAFYHSQRTRGAAN